MRGADVCLCHTGFWGPLGVISFVSTMTGDTGIWIEYLCPSISVCLGKITISLSSSHGTVNRSANTFLRLGR